MRDRIEIKHESEAEPIFPEIGSRARLERRRTPRDGEDQSRAAIHKQIGGIPNKVLHERTGAPLKIVFIARLHTSSQEKAVGACRRLAEALSTRGHRLLILECHPHSVKQDEPPGPGQIVFYESVKELKERFAHAIRSADFVMICSNVSEGATIGDWATQIAQGITAFYDLNTPVTLAKLNRGESEHLSPSLITRYNLYLSFTGGPLLELIKKYYRSPLVRSLYGSVDTSVFYPEAARLKWDLGYGGYITEDRLPGVDELLLEPARHWPGGHFAVAGHRDSASSDWPCNVKRVHNLATSNERAFYNAQRFTLNVTGADMIEAGFSPGLQIFEAAACGTPIISDYWEDLLAFFTPDEEILFARSAEEMLDYLRDIGDKERFRIGDNARNRVLKEHSTEQRVLELESYVMEAIARA